MTLTEGLREVLDGPFGALRQRFRAELPAELFAPLPPDATIEEHRAETWRRLEILASTGMQVLPGVEPVAAFELLGHANLSLFVKVGVQFGLFAGVVKNLGTQRHHDDVLPHALDLTLPGCFAMTETGHGSDVQGLLTTATYEADTDELVINSPVPAARKEYIGNAARDARVAATFAQLIVDGINHGVHCILVPIRDEHGAALPGVTITDCGEKLGLLGVDNGRLMFDQVRVPRTNLLNQYGNIVPSKGDDPLEPPIRADNYRSGAYVSPIESRNRRFFTMLGTLVRGRVTVGGAGAAAARSALTLAVGYGLRRRQFPNPLAEDGDMLLLDYQAHQLKLLPLVARSYVLQSAQHDLVAALERVESGDFGGDEDHARRELEARAAGLKAVQTRHATDTIQTCREACGGAGYMAVNQFANLKADTDVFTTFEGDNTVLLQLLGKSLLTQYARDVAELDPVGIARFVARQVTGTVVEHVGGGVVQRLLAGAPANADKALVDRGGQLAILTDREQHLLDGLAQRLRAAPKGDPVASARLYNESQDHLLAAAEAHVERISLEAYLEATADENATDPEVRQILDLVADLYVHDVVFQHRAWFLEHGRLTPNQSKEVVRRRSALCAELRPHATALVDAFAIPPAWLPNELLDA